MQRANDSEDILLNVYKIWLRRGFHFFGINAKKCLKKHFKLKFKTFFK